MADPPIRYATYEAPHGPEWMTVHGPDEEPRALILPPLFGEANAMRATIVDLARQLARAGIGSAIVDLPGTGESMRPLDVVDLQDWRAAAAAAGRTLGRPHVVALRGGALCDDAVDGRSWWRFAPAPGGTLLRQLERAQRVADRETGGASADDGGGIVMAGYRMSAPFAAALRLADPAPSAGPLRTVPFDGPGLAPWRRAEPAADRALAARLAADIADWIRACAA